MATSSPSLRTCPWLGAALTPGCREHFSSLVDSETHIVCISELFVQIVPSY